MNDIYNAKNIFIGFTIVMGIILSVVIIFHPSDVQIGGIQTELSGATRTTSLTDTGYFNTTEYISTLPAPFKSMNITDKT